MTKSKNTKRALLVSVLSLMLCVAMLIGSTFAWFTDSVTSGKNKIVAGNLDVELYTKNGESYVPVTEETNLFMKDALWEPGHVEVVNLKVANLGTLALQYKFGINIPVEKPGTNAAGKIFNLSDYIMFALIDGEQNYTDREAAIAAAESNAVKLSALAVNQNGVLYPADTEGKDSEKLVTLVVYMPTTVGNEVNYKTGTDAPEIDLGVTLVATQVPFESDSFNENYDANATLKNEVAKFTFANASDAAVFCPDCYNAGSTADHAKHASYLTVKNGVAEVERTGAWLNFADLNWAENSYAMDYDVDLAALDNNAFIAFDAGEQTTWADLQIGFKKTDAGITAYNTLFSNQLSTKELGTIGEKVHITYTFVPVGSDLNMTATVTDGANTYTVERTVKNFADATKLCWNVYTVEGDADTYATLDNVVFHSASRFQFSKAMAEGGYVRLPEDTMTLSKTPIDKDTTIELGNNELLLLPNRNLEVHAGDIKIQNGTISANHSFGYIDIRDVTAPVNLQFENIEFQCTEAADSRGGQTNNIISGFVPDQKDVSISFKNCTFKNAAVDLSSDKIKSVSFDNCTFENVTSSSDVTVNLQNVPTTDIRFHKCIFKITNVFGTAEPVNLTRASGDIVFTECEFNVNQTVTENGVCCALTVSRLPEGSSLTIKNCKFDVASNANAVCQVIDASYNYNNLVVITDNEAKLTFNGTAYHTFVTSSSSKNVTIENNNLTGF